MEKVVVVDSGIEQLNNNRLFDRELAYKVHHTLMPLCYVAEEAKKQGITFITPDVFLASPEAYQDKQVLLMSHLVSPLTSTLIARGAKPLLLTCQESPFVATRFYINLKQYTSLFTHSILFPGMEKRISKKTHFLPMFFSQYFENIPFEPIAFSDKKSIVYVASNKETKSLLKTIVIKALYGWNVQLIYAIRRRIIRTLSERGDFDLYGRGWDSDKEEYIQKVYKGGVDDKEKKLREYKFVLALENAVFPGYITEKIFDAFFARTIPVYRGAPDIATYIPHDTFINLAEFKNIEEAILYMEHMDEATYALYLEKIEAFLKSDAYARFSHTQFAEKVISLIQAA